jgi:UDP:flavonoid glycosyltransferase YjiC (YdhE family)
VNVVISSAGSVGDVLPHVAVGWELKRRGHTVTLVANASFERWAK